MSGGYDRAIVVVPSLGRRDLVEQLTRSMAGTITGLRVLVAQDWAKQDMTWAKRAGWAVMPQAGPLSFARAVNMGVAQGAQIAKANGFDWRWVLLLNNDLILRPGFWGGAQFMMQHGYEIAGGKLLYPNGTIQHCGKWFTMDFYPFHALRWQGADEPHTMEPRPYPAVTFACALIKREVWEGLEGLDEQFVNGYEDDDFCLRARECGACIGVHPDMAAIHLESQTTGQDNDNKEAQWRRFRAKWVETGRISWALGMHMGWRSL